MPRVRSHTRTINGEEVGVRAHRRRLQPGRGMANLGRAHSAMRHQRRTAGFTLAALGLGEIAAWFTLKGVGVLLVTAGIVVLGVGYLLTRTTSVKSRGWGTHEEHHDVDPFRVRSRQQHRSPDTEGDDPEAEAVRAAADLGRRHAEQDVAAGGFARGYDGKASRQMSDRERDAYDAAYTDSTPASWRQ